MSIRRQLLVPLITTAATVVGVAVAPAASASGTYTWTGAGGTTNWSDSGNWSGNVAPSGTGAAVVFPTGVTNKTTTDDLDKTVVTAITFNDNGYTVSGNQLAPSTIIVAASATAIINDDMSSEQSSTMQIGLATGSTLRLTGVLSGTTGVMTTSSGTLDLAGTTANTLTGLLDVEGATTALFDKPAGVPVTAGDVNVGGAGGAATIRWAASNQMPTTNHIIQPIDKGTLDLNGFSDSVWQLEMNSGTVTTGAGTLTVTGDIYDNNVSGSVTGNLHLTSSATHIVGEANSDNRLTIDAHLTGDGAINKTGDGILTLNDACAYTGPLTVSAGSVSAPNGYGGSTTGSFTGGTCPVVDSTAPTVNVTSAPPTVTSSTSATVSFTANDPDDTSGLTVTCAADGAAASSCTSPYSATGLSDGSHTLTIVARDPAGNASSPASVTWTVDTAAPIVSQSTATLATTSGLGKVRWTATDSGTGIASYDVRWRRAAWNAGFGSWVYPSAWQATTATSGSLALTRGYDYCLQVRARDRVTNLSGWVADSCIGRVLDDRAMSIGAGWKKLTGKGYFSGTYVATTKLGAALTRTGARLDRVGILATKCPTCGTVAIYVGRTRIGVVKLTARTTRKQQLIVLPRFSYRSGAVRIVTTTRKSVQVDGVFIART